MEDLVSVIITTYRRSDKIENAIKSVLNQTYKNIEIIVVDDNAEFEDERKKTENIVKKFQNIKLIQNKKNLRPALSRNEGIYVSKGTYIAFLDDDDEYTSQKIEKQYKLFKEKEKTNENPGLIFCNVYGADQTKAVSVDYNLNVIYQQMMNCLCPTSFWFTSRKVLNDIGYFDDSQSKEDSIVLLKILIKGYNLYKVDEGLIIFNKHDNDSGMSGYKLSNINGEKEYRKWCRKYYHKLDNENQINDVEINFSKQLITYLVINNMIKEAKNELKNIKKRRILSKKYFLGIFKIYFRKIYLKRIGIKYEKNTILQYFKNVYTEIFYKINRFKKFNILDDEETVEMIIKEKKSISRYGDGELKWALGVEQESFQKLDEKLEQRLLEILNEDNKNLLICIPIGLKCTKDYSEKVEMFWMTFVRWYGRRIKKILNSNLVYGNASFTRWYLDNIEKDDDYYNRKLKNLKTIWDRRNIVIVEGAGTKIGIGNDLLDNAYSIKRIIAPSLNAFDYYDNIIESIEKNVNKENLLLLALGPTATVLASDLSKKGYQAIDVGHIDIEYEWFKMEVREKCMVPGKSVNEAGVIERDYTKNSNREYLESIIEVVGEQL